MPDLKVEGVESSVIFEMIATEFEKMPEAEKKAQMKKVNGIFQLNVKGSSGKEGQWTIDFKKEGKVYKGPAKPKADVIINMEDKVFKDLADGKLNGQKAFMRSNQFHHSSESHDKFELESHRSSSDYSGKLKVKGNMMLATKLDVLLKGAKAKL